MRKFVLSLFALALIASPALAQYNQVVSPGDKAPDLSGITAVKGEEEATINLSDIDSDVVVVTFLANHCPVVVAYEDRLIELAEAYQDKSVTFVGIACTAKDAPQAATDDLEGIKRQVKEKGYNFVYGYDPSGEAGKAYGATVTPQVYVLDKDRTIQYTGSVDDSQNEGRVQNTYLKDAIDAVLAGESVEVTETRAFGCAIKYAR